MINLISCISSNGAIGNNQDLIFHIKEDMQHFKKLTSGTEDYGSIVIMGRKTFESIISINGKPLPNRLNVVLTTDTNYKSRYGEQVYHSVDKIISHHETFGEKDKKIFVIGGNSLYKQFLPFADNVFLTIVNKHIEEADTFFPIAEMEELKFKTHIESEDFYSEKYDAYYKFVKYIKN